MWNNVKLISVDGLDKAGKHTAILVLENYFQSMGLKVATLSFPNYGSPTGDLIHAWLKGQQSFDQNTFELLQAADKQAMQGAIAQFEEDGVDVLLFDRYIHTQWAYGSYKSDMTWLRSLNHEIRMPDAVIYLDVEPEVSLHRKGKFDTNDRYEDDLEHLRHARAAYLNLFGHGGICPDMYVQTLDANQPQLLVKASLFQAAKRIAWSLNLTGERVAAL